jgi:phenylpropionate dioxygenase-like ring-hydroxylating dioxygenase large terminal subunit
MNPADEDLFGDASNLWIPAEHSRRLTDSPRRVWVAGQAIALFRDRRGVAHALFDRCPHRGVALSLGRVLEDGCLECPFHGWRFAGDGTCAKVPFDPHAKRDHLRAQSLPIVERGGLLWIHTSTTLASHDRGPEVPEALERSDLRRRIHEVNFATHWTRVMENMLDTPHLPWVHRATIGRDMLRHPDDTLTFQLDPRPHGFRLTWQVSGVPAAPPWLEWWRPCGMVINLDEARGSYRLHVFCVPGKPGETRLLFVSSRKFVLGLDRLLGSMMSRFEDRILGEDKRVIESSQPAVVPRPSEERSVSTDEPTLRFRKWYWQHRDELGRKRVRGLPVAG